jgi:predicted DNA-binding transcriptional regulator AlpA
MDENAPLAFRVSDAGKKLGIGRSSVYQLFAEGELTPIKIGRATVVDAAELADLLKRRREAARALRKTAAGVE